MIEACRLPQSVALDFMLTKNMGNARSLKVKQEEDDTKEVVMKILGDTIISHVNEEHSKIAIGSIKCHIKDGLREYLVIFAPVKEKVWAQNPKIDISKEFSNAWGKDFFENYCYE